MVIATRPELVVLPNSETPADRSIEKRRLRKHVVLNAIRRQGPLSRAEISKCLGYNLPSVSSLVDELIADGLVIEESARAIPRGRRPIPVQLNSQAAAVLGIDLGRRSSIAMLVNLGGEVVARCERPTPVLKTPKARAKWGIEMAQRVFAAAPAPRPPLAGIGMAIPGLVIKNRATSSVSRDEVDDLKRALEEEFEVPAFVENDARMMALGSLWFGDGKSFESFIVVNIGHGVGTGIVMDGRVVSGQHGFAGELGYLPLGEPNVPGFLDRPNALENLVSGAGLLRKAEQKGLKVEDVSALAELARGGHKGAAAIFDDFARALGLGIASLLNLLDPQAVIFSGRVSRAADVFLAKALEEARRHTLPPIWESTTIKTSSLDVDLGPLGAAACVLHQIFENAHVEVDEVI